MNDSDYETSQCALTNFIMLCTNVIGNLIGCLEVPILDLTGREKDNNHI